jgi:Clp protease
MLSYLNDQSAGCRAGPSRRRDFNSADHHTLSPQVIARPSTFAGRACLAAAVTVAALTLPLAPANAALGKEQGATNASHDFNKKDGAPSLYIEWSGPIAAGMADYLRTELGRYGTASRRVVLFLNSAGGQVEEGDRVIEVLNKIKQMHRLITVVGDGELCASMCIPIFLQGHDRLAARTSLWIFHQAAKREANGKKREDMEETLRLFLRYYVPAGVSMDWIKSIAPIIKKGNLLQTGGDLISAKTGIIMHSLENWTERVVAALLSDADRGLTPTVPE